MHAKPEHFSIETYPAVTEKYCVSWEAKEGRFHVWLKGPGSFDPGAVLLYQNPPRHVAPGDPGHFSTRQIDISGHEWTDVCLAIMEIPAAQFQDALDMARRAADTLARDLRATGRQGDMTALEGLLSKYFPGIDLSELAMAANGGKA